LPEVHWVARSDALAAELGLSSVAAQRAGAAGAWRATPPRRDLAPLATVYSGHQFGVWAGQLG
jgi:uncharacterized protein YdiU (UPF0061 family)